MPAGLNVLWATDGSECALAAIPMMRSLVLPVTDTVRVLTVAPEPTLSGARLDPVSVKPTPRKERTEAVERAMRVARTSGEGLDLPNVAVHPSASFGHPIREILRAADRDKVDLIVLGAKGHSNLRLMLLGSVAQGVLQYAKRPVLLVRPGSTKVQRAIIGVDGTKEALRAIEFLDGLALEKGSLLVLTTVVQLISRRPSLRETDARFSIEASRINEDTMRQAERDIADALGVLSQPSRDTQNEILVGKPGEELLKAAAEWRADLIVVGSRTPSRVRKYLIGGTAEMVAREALASVLVVR